MDDQYHECKNCASGYRVRPENKEIYCGFCGCALNRFEQILLNKSDALLYASHDGMIPLRIQLHNTGMFAIKNISLLVNNKQYNVTSDKWITCSQIPKSLSPEQIEIVTLEVTPRKHPNYPNISSFAFMFLSRDDRTIKKKNIEISFLQDPDFNITPEFYEIEIDSDKMQTKDDSDQFWHMVSLNVQLIKSEVFLREIEAVVDGEPNLKIDVKCDMIGRKVIFDNNNQFDVKIYLKASDFQTERTYHIKLSFLIKNARPYTSKITVKLTRPPRLEIMQKNGAYLNKNESIINEVYERSKPYPERLNLVNSGSGELFLEKIEICTADGHEQHDNIIFFDFDNKQEIRIESAEVINYLIHSDQLMQQQIDLVIAFHYFYENENKTRQTLTKNCKMAIALKQFHEGRMLAVDFGTTNTYCAMYLEWENEYELAQIPHEKLGQKEGNVVPTSISYYVPPAYNPVDFGRMSYLFYRRGEKNSFRSFKRNLGETPTLLREKYWIHYPDDRPALKSTADNISFDFLNEFIEHVHVATGCHFNNYVFTHPTSFPISKLSRFRNIINRLGIDNRRFYMIDEATASALDFIQDHPGHYYLLVYDFGGGTIDIAYIEVDIQNTNTILIDIIDVDGDGEFGGDDITQAMVDLINDKLIQIDDTLLVESNNKNYDHIVEEYMKKNMQVIWTTAEEIKKTTLFEQKTVNLNHFLPVLYYESSLPNNMPEKKRINDTVEISANEVESQIFDKIKESIELVNTIFLKNPKEKLELDRYILLSGRSVVIPIVRKMFECYQEGKYPVWSNDSIEKEPDTHNTIHITKDDVIKVSTRTKECVARGAANFGRSLFTSSEVDYQITGVGDYTTSRFGNVDFGIKKFIEYIPKNKKYVPENKTIDEHEIDNYAIYKTMKNFIFDDYDNLITPIDIYQNFGRGNQYNEKKCKKVGSFLIKKPENCENQIKGELCIQLMETLVFKVTVKINNNWYDAMHVNEME